MRIHGQCLSMQGQLQLVCWLILGPPLAWPPPGAEIYPPPLSENVAVIFKEDQIGNSHYQCMCHLP